MAYFSDLHPINYFPLKDPGALRAVGWLENGRDYAKGPVSESDFGRLFELLTDPWEPVSTGGAHSCDFCRFSHGPATVRFGGSEVRVGISNLFLPAGDVVYVSPSLILHYIDSHGYQPPEVFLQAVRRCPSVKTMDFKKLLLASGGRGLRPT